MSIVGNRRHIFGISSHEMSFRLWYFDRSGSVRTPAMRLDDHTFVRTLLKLTHSTASDFGFEDIFPPENDDEYVSSSSSLNFLDILDCKINIQDTWFVLLERIHVSFELYGRGTAVYGAKDLATMEDDDSDGSAPSPEVVVKISWQNCAWKSEDAMYRLAEKHDVRGIAHLYRSAAITRLSRSLRSKLVPISSYRDRELRVQVIGPLAVPLYSVKDLDTFTMAFKSLVRGTSFRKLEQLSSTDGISLRSPSRTVREGRHSPP